MGHRCALKLFRLGSKVSSCILSCITVVFLAAPNLCSVRAQVSDPPTDAPAVAGQSESPEPTSPPADAPSASAESSDSAADSTSEEALSAVGKVSYFPTVQRILHFHCHECHGAKQAKAEMRVDDRDALLSYIEPGDLESSSLWGDYLTTTDTEMRMPPVKAGNPLSELELAAIRVWIEDGAEWPEDSPPFSESETGAAVVPEKVETADTDSRNIVERLWTFLGFFHPAVVHFPIGLLLVSSLFIVLALMKRHVFEPAAFHCLWIGTVGAVVASLAGWAFADIRGYGDFWHTSWNDDLIARHRISGLAVTVSAITLSCIAFFARRRTSSDLRILWIIGALGLAGMVSLVGHQGGELTYGEELFSRAYEQAFGSSDKAQGAGNSQSGISNAAAPSSTPATTPTAVASPVKTTQPAKVNP